MHLQGAPSPICSRSPMNMSWSIDKTQVAIYILITWKSNPARSQSRMCVDEDADVSGTQLCAWVFLPTFRHWQSFGLCLFFFPNVVTKRAAGMLHCTRSVSPSLGLFLHCVAETGLKYQVECPTCTWAGFPLSVINTRHYHKGKTKQRPERVLFYFPFSFFAAVKGDYVLLLFAAVSGRKSLFALRVSRLPLHCVNCWIHSRTYELGYLIKHVLYPWACLTFFGLIAGCGSNAARQEADDSYDRNES